MDDSGRGAFRVLVVGMGWSLFCRLGLKFTDMTDKLAKLVLSSIHCCI